MARQQASALIDDIDGGRAHETVIFGLDGLSYEIDLSDQKAAAFRKSLAGFLAAARPMKPDGKLTASRATASRTMRAAGEPTAAQIRQWATAAGLRVSRRGRIAASVRDQYMAVRAS